MERTGEDGLQGCCQGERTRQSDSGGSGSGRKIAQNYFPLIHIIPGGGSQG